MRPTLVSLDGAPVLFWRGETVFLTVWAPVDLLVGEVRWANGDSGSPWNGPNFDVDYVSITQATCGVPLCPVLRVTGSVKWSIVGGLTGPAIAWRLPATLEDGAPAWG